MATRDKRGRWQRGQSGNPNGRSKQAAHLRQMLEEGSQQAAERVLEACRGGDMQACKLVLERVLPPVRPTHAAVTFNLDSDRPLADQGRDILRAVAEGVLPPDQGKALLDALASMSRIVELDEIAARLAHLEEQSNG